MIDRFGLLPPPTKALFSISEVKLIADQIGILKLDIGAGGGSLEFAPDTSVAPITIVKLLQTKAGTFRMNGASGLKFTLPLPEAEDRLEFALGLLKELGA